jgi:uncharacterized protein YyaL (SSP411 family)
MCSYNQLTASTSPYLLQHARNPINWHTWGIEALHKATQEDKPVLLSIGYAACHWCHVMAKESFEKEEVAIIMNKYFINIKIDREEDPDVDQIAIAAMQAMGIQVGWPLHVFLMPNQQPFYGCTYLPTVAWKQLLNSIATAFREHRAQLTESSFYFVKTLLQREEQHLNYQANTSELTWICIKQVFQKIYQHLDPSQGGIQGAPKFPLPGISMFLLQYYRICHNKEALQQLDITLTKMACGGIYDHLAGGFYRYTVDEAWKIPHFEKMLCDNAQLISLYAHAYIDTNNPLYKAIVEETIAFVVGELFRESGGFYSSLDADSQGSEGAFYTWTYEEIESILQENTSFFIRYFPVTKDGNWHNGLNILYREIDTLSNQKAYQPTDIEKELNQAKQALYTVRVATRPRPSLDNKIITSWNGMMVQALIDAYYALGEEYFLDLALQNATYIETYLIQGDQVWHSYSQDKRGRTGYLEDYAWLIKAFVSLYEATFQESWLYKAEKLIQYVFCHFAHEYNNLFYFTDTKEPIFIKRTQEIFDQVIPSSNAIMAYNLFRLGNLLKREAYTEAFHKMLAQVAHTLQYDSLYMAYWANLHLLKLCDIPVVVILGSHSLKWAPIIKRYYPELLLTGGLYSSTIPWLANYKIQKDETTVYVCDAKACYASFNTLEKTLEWLSKWKSQQDT